VFIAQATNTPLSFGDLMLVLGVSLITSKGAHGVPGSAIVILAATLNAVPSIPAIGLVLVLSVDWFIGMARALGNLVGNCIATVVIAAWEGDLDRDTAHRVLDGAELVDVTAGYLDLASRTRCSGAPQSRDPISVICWTPDQQRTTPQVIARQRRA
jgi:aerobic C4-dicarboxylate transport protein